MPQFYNAVLAKDTTDCTAAFTGGLQVSGGAYVAKQLRVSGIVNILNATDSTSYTNGSFITAGGIGSAGAINTQTSISAGTTITAGGVITGASFSGSGSGLTSVPPGALLSGGSDGQVLAKNGTSWAWASPVTNPMTTLGDIITGGASGVPGRLAGNTTATAQFLKSLGSGSAANAPTWAQISAADLSDGVSGSGNLVKVTGPTFTGGKVTLAATATGYASLNVPAGTAPATPASGDVWNVGGKAKWHDGTRVIALTDATSSLTGNGATSVDPVGITAAKINLTGDATLNMAAGGYDTQRLTLEVTQDASGNHTVTLGTGFVWGADVTSYSVTATPNKTDYIGLIYSSSAAAWRVIAIAKGY